MAAPLLTFYSLIQPGVTLNPSQGWGTLIGESGSNGYDAGCPGFRISGTSTVDMTIAANAEAGVTFYANAGWSTTDQAMITLKGPTQSLLRLACVSTQGSDSPQKFQYWNGSSWVQIGTNIEVAAWVSKRIDITWKLHASTGFFRVYVGGTLHAEFTGNTIFTADTGIQTATFRSCETGVSGGSMPFWHLFMDSGEDVRRLWMAVDEPLSNGFWTDWVGERTDVDDYPYETNAQLTYIRATAAGQKETYNMGTINTGLNTGVVETVITGIWGRALAEPGFHCKPIMRKSTTDYQPPGSFQLKAELDYFMGVQMNNDPSTGSPWASFGDVEAHQVGFEATLAA